MMKDEIHLLDAMKMKCSGVCGVNCMDRREDVEVRRRVGVGVKISNRKGWKFEESFGHMEHVSEEWVITHKQNFSYSTASIFDLNDELSVLNLTCLPAT